MLDLERIVILSVGVLLYVLGIWLYARVVQKFYISISTLIMFLGAHLVIWTLMGGW